MPKKGERAADVDFEKYYANMVSSAALLKKVSTKTEEWTEEELVGSGLLQSREAALAALEKNRKDSAANLRDGKLGEHIGYGPKMKSGSSADVSKGREWNVQYEGKGELGKILLDFQWNMQEAAAGWAEAAKPIYDQKLWEAGGFMEPPTVRQITDVGMQVVSGVLSAAVAAGTAGIAAGFAPLIGFGVNAIDDLLFAGLDMGTTKNAGDVWADFGKKTVVNAVSSAIGYGFSGVEVGASALAKGAMAATETMTTTVATSIVGSIDMFRTWELDAEAVVKSGGFDGVGFIANVLASGVSAGVGGMFSNALSDAEMKYWGNMTSLASAMSGEAAKYGVHAAFNLAMGNGRDSFTKAYDDMGGLTFNLVSTGTIARMLGVDAKMANEMSVGLYELHLTSSGASGRIGTGGIDVSGAAYDVARNGVDYWRMQTATRTYTETAKRMIEDRPFEDILFDDMDSQLTEESELELEVEKPKEPTILLSEGEKYKIEHNFPITPIEEGKYTIDSKDGGYGARPTIEIGGKGTKLNHDGIDLSAPKGTSVRSVLDGEIHSTGYDEIFGNNVIIKHNDNFYTFYAHLDTVIVKMGDKVAGGQVFGTVGTTGFSSGPHLHFEYRRSDKKDSYFNPRY